MKDDMIFSKWCMGSFDPFKDNVLIRILRDRNHIGNSQPHKEDDSEMPRNTYNILLEHDKQDIHKEYWNQVLQ